MHPHAGLMHGVELHELPPTQRLAWGVIVQDFVTIGRMMLYSCGVKYRRTVEPCTTYQQPPSLDNGGQVPHGKQCLCYCIHY